MWDCLGPSGTVRDRQGRIMWERPGPSLDRTGPDHQINNPRMEAIKTERKKKGKQLVETT